MIGNTGVLGLTVLFELLRELTDWQTSINVLVLMLGMMNAAIALLRVPSANMKRRAAFNPSGTSAPPFQ